MEWGESREHNLFLEFFLHDSLLARPKRMPSSHKKATGLISGVTIKGRKGQKGMMQMGSPLRRLYSIFKASIICSGAHHHGSKGPKNEEGLLLGAFRRGGNAFLHDRR